MLVYAHFTANPLANIDYLLACPETGECVAIDPWEAEPLLHTAQARGWEIRHIVNTHAHWDHTRGNEKLVELTGAQLFCHPNARSEISPDARPLNDGAEFKIGQRSLRVLDTPGHTMSHVCLLGESDVPFLVSGDTLFNAGAGNCHNGGHPEVLFESFRDCLWKLPDNVELLPGHDYLSNNLRFSLDREPGNRDTQRHLKAIEGGQSPRMTLGEERQFNPFFRLDEPEVIDGLRAAFPKEDLTEIRARFLAMRRLRNRW